MSDFFCERIREVNREREIQREFFLVVVKSCSRLRCVFVFFVMMMMLMMMMTIRKSFFSHAIKEF